MNLEELDSLCMSHKGATRDYPFGPNVAVYKVMNKMFALIGEDDENLQMNLKCDPDEADALRANFKGIIPGYHMNKVHWNSVLQNSDVPDELIASMIKDSYDIIVAKLTKKQKQELENL